MLNKDIPEPFYWDDTPPENFWDEVTESLFYTYCAVMEWLTEPLKKTRFNLICFGFLCYIIGSLF